MACAAAAAGKDANTGTANSGLVAAATGGGAASTAPSSSSAVVGAVGGSGSSSSTAAVVSGAPQSNGGVINRQSRFAMEGVGARVIRGPDWKWGKQVGLCTVK